MPNPQTGVCACGALVVPGLRCCAAAQAAMPHTPAGPLANTLRHLKAGGSMPNRAGVVRKLPKAGPPAWYVGQQTKAPGRASNIGHGRDNYGLARCTNLLHK
jgi:hypothetical protein